jgi:hypothetical protein
LSLPVTPLFPGNAIFLNVYLSLKNLHSVGVPCSRDSALEPIAWARSAIRFRRDLISPSIKNKTKKKSTGPRR